MIQVRTDRIEEVYSISVWIWRESEKKKCRVCKSRTRWERNNDFCTWERAVWEKQWKHFLLSYKIGFWDGKYTFRSGRRDTDWNDFLRGMFLLYRRTDKSWLWKDRAECRSDVWEKRRQLWAWSWWSQVSILCSALEWGNVWRPWYCEGEGLSRIR